jgi:uncharacterized membrane protein YebE (DUF533 family)
MNLQNLMNQFIGSNAQGPKPDGAQQGIGDSISKMVGNIPGGLVGGAAAGGIMTLLLGNKSARKFAGKAAKYGGAAVLGGLTYKAFQSWQQNSAGQTNGTSPSGMTTPDESAFLSSDVMQPAFELTLIKAMIAAAKADGHIDQVEQQRIFNAVEEMNLPNEMKGMVFDLLQQEITVEELVRGLDKVEQKSELYLASCLAINPDHPSEKAHLDQLAAALALPQGLTHELQWQAQKAISEAP